MRTHFCRMGFNIQHSALSTQRMLRRRRPGLRQAHSLNHRVIEVMAHLQHCKLEESGQSGQSRKVPEWQSVTTVVLFGELLMDCFPDREIPGGAPFNVACHLQGLAGQTGLRALLLTRLGRDERGLRLRQAVQAAGLQTTGVQMEAAAGSATYQYQHPSGHVAITLDADSGSHQFSIPPAQAWDFIHADSARQLVQDTQPAWLYYGTLAQRQLAHAAGHNVSHNVSHGALQAILKASPARRFVDVNLRHPWVTDATLRSALQQAQIAKMNEDELREITQRLGLSSARTCSAQAAALLQAFALQQLLVTRGEQGAMLLLADGSRLDAEPAEQLAPFGQRVVMDTVGAGDAFSAVFLLGLIRHWPAQLTLNRAHQFAGAICQLRGAIPENQDFYQTYVTAWQLAGEAPM